jgi:hypothetical protein
MLKPGDRITVSLNPTIRIAEYNSIHPFVSIGRDVGENPQQDVEEVTQAVQDLLHLAIKKEVEVWVGVVSALGTDINTDAVIQHCEQEAAHARPETQVQPAATREPATQAPHGPRKVHKGA